MNLENYENILIKLLFHHNNLVNEYSYFIENKNLFKIVSRTKTSKGFFFTIEKPLNFLSKKLILSLILNIYTQGKNALVRLCAG